jgi:hypothetical protein
MTDNLSLPTTTTTTTTSPRSPNTHVAPIDRGTKTSAPLDDLEGKPRGTLVDVGAYET